MKLSYKKSKLVFECEDCPAFFETSALITAHQFQAGHGPEFRKAEVHDKFPDEQ